MENDHASDSGLRKVTFTVHLPKLLLKLVTQQWTNVSHLGCTPGPNTTKESLREVMRINTAQLPLSCMMALLAVRTEVPRHSTYTPDSLAQLMLWAAV
jgi:hypothetical protein